jgi:hypothetical protein
MDRSWFHDWQIELQNRSIVRRKSISKDIALYHASLKIRLKMEVFEKVVVNIY